MGPAVRSKVEPWAQGTRGLLTGPEHKTQGKGVPWLQASAVLPCPARSKGCGGMWRLGCRASAPGFCEFVEFLFYRWPHLNLVGHTLRSKRRCICSSVQNTLFMTTKRTVRPCTCRRGRQRHSLKPLHGAARPCRASVLLPWGARAATAVPMANSCPPCLTAPRHAAAWAHPCLMPQVGV